MKKQSEYKFGFSLIELSIVILMIGILIGGVTKGIAILDKSKISSAISLTTISPVARIPNLVAWYETTLPSSFFSNTLFDGSNLVRNPATGSHWNDNSPEKNNNINTAPTGALTYIEFGINNLPAVN
ncbi:MAG: prepilin-type N-terminal cleavage/methylation domain-containing protein, partial [Rickettsiales bacterium]